MPQNFRIHEFHQRKVHNHKASFTLVSRTPTLPALNGASAVVCFDSICLIYIINPANIHSYASFNSTKEAWVSKKYLRGWRKFELHEMLKKKLLYNAVAAAASDVCNGGTLKCFPYVCANPNPIARQRLDNDESRNTRKNSARSPPRLIPFPATTHSPTKILAN
jgi:hypothetical protein